LNGTIFYFLWPKKGPGLTKHGQSLSTGRSTCVKPGVERGNWGPWLYTGICTVGEKMQTDVVGYKRPESKTCPSSPPWAWLKIVKSGIDKITAILRLTRRRLKAVYILEKKDRCCIVVCTPLRSSTCGCARGVKHDVSLKET